MHPVATERRRQRERPFGVGLSDRPAERRVEVVDLGVEPGEVLLAARAPQRPFGSVALGEREVVAVVALADRLARRRRGEALARVGADRLEHAAAGSGACAYRRRTSRLLATRSVERVEAGAGDGLGRLDRRAAGEHGEAREARLLGVAEQVVAPVDRRAQRLLARGRVAGAGAQRAERACPGARRSRRRRAVRSARRPARSRAAARRGAGRSPRRRPALASPRSNPGSWARARSQNSATASTPASASESPVPELGQRERRHGVALLGLQRERLATRREHRERRTGREQPADERRRGRARARSCRPPAAGAWRPGSARPPAPATRPERTIVPSASTIAAATSSGRCRAASETKRAPSAKSASTRARGLQREPRLADPARAGQREQPDRARSQPFADRVEIVLATDRAVGRHRQPGHTSRASRAGVGSGPSVSA